MGFGISVLGHFGSSARFHSPPARPTLFSSTTYLLLLTRPTTTTNQGAAVTCPPCLVIGSTVHRCCAFAPRPQPRWAANPRWLSAAACWAPLTAIVVVKLASVWLFNLLRKFCQQKLFVQVTGHELLSPYSLALVSECHSWHSWRPDSKFMRGSTSFIKMGCNAFHPMSSSSEADEERLQPPAEGRPGTRKGSPG